MDTWGAALQGRFPATTEARLKASAFWLGCSHVVVASTLQCIIRWMSLACTARACPAEVRFSGCGSHASAHQSPCKLAKACCCLSGDACTRAVQHVAVIVQDLAGPESCLLMSILLRTSSAQLVRVKQQTAMQMSRAFSSGVAEAALCCHADERRAEQLAHKLARFLRVLARAKEVHVAAAQQQGSSRQKLVQEAIRLAEGALRELQQCEGQDLQPGLQHLWSMRCHEVGPQHCSQHGQLTGSTSLPVAAQPCRQMGADCSHKPMDGVRC